MLETLPFEMTGVRAAQHCGADRNNSVRCVNYGTGPFNGTRPVSRIG